MGDALSSAIGEAVPVQVGRAQAGTDHGFHLRAEFDLDLVQPSWREQITGPDDRRGDSGL